MPPRSPRPARFRPLRWLPALGAALVVGVSIVGGLMTRFGAEGWKVSGVVDAPPDRVWQALLEETASLSEDDRRAVARHDSSQPLVFKEPGAQNARTEVDGQRRSIAVQGEWWYRGTTSVAPHGDGSSLVAYRVENIAPGPSWWIAQLFQGPSLARGMRSEHQQLLDAIGRRLGARSYLLDG